MPTTPVPVSLSASSAPRSPADLFVSFTWLALQGFGGVLAVAQRVLVENKRWMSREEFVEEWAVAQTLPGPNVINLALMIGARHFGLRGALAALAGMLLAPLAVVLLLVLLYSRFAHLPEVAGALRGMGAVAAGLVAAVGIKLMPTLRKHPLGPWLAGAFAALAFVCVALLRLPLVAVIAVVGGAACVLTWRRLGTPVEPPR